LNLAVVAQKFNLAAPKDAFVAELQKRVRRYWGTLVHIAICSPELFEKTAAGYRLCKVIDLQSARSLVDMTDLSAILKSHDVEKLHEHVFEIITFITGRDQRQLLRELVPLLIKERATCGIAKAFFLEDSSLSRQFAAAVAQTEWEHDRAELLRAWTHYLVPEDAFEFCWWVLCWTPRTNDFGKTFEDRFAALRSLLLDEPQDQMFHRRIHREWKESHQWRQWYVGLFGALCGLVGKDRWSRVDEEMWVRQSEAAELITAQPSHLKSVVHGILAKGKEHWDVLDPIILGLPSQPTLECLEQYADTHGQSHDDYFHAKRLLAHMRGEMPVNDPRPSASGLMGAVENLIIASRTKMPDLRNRTWLGDAGVESLWHGAIETAVREFTDYLTSQYGQDEHEHAAVLADGLARQLNSTNAIVSQWLRKKQALPLFIQASVRRFPKTAPGDSPQEGGPGGLQADMGMLMTCNVPGMMKAQRLTLIQAKKLKRVEGPERWGTGFPFKGKEYTQLERLLLLSQQAHYLFFISPDLGCPSLVLPAFTVKDSCKSATAQSVPLSVVRNGGVAIADFMLHGIIGLWTGDESEKLIARCKEGCEIGQGPRIMIEVRVSSEGEGHQ
jgi:hypothetical protein